MNQPDAEFVADNPEAFTERVAEAIEKHDPSVRVALVSGGHDSAAVVLASIAAGIPVDLIAHANTGIGIEASREYVRYIAAQTGTPYVEGLPPEGDRIADIIMGKENREDDNGSGNPGSNPQSHGPTRERLKGRFKDKLHQSFDGTVVFITGVRRAESNVRWESLNPTGIDVSGRKGHDYIWANPITNYTGRDVRDTLQKHDIEPNPVRDFLGYSGECLCFAFESFLSLGKVYTVAPETVLCIYWLMRFVNAWWEAFPEDEKPWPRQYLIPGHGGLKDREKKFLLDGPLQDSADFRDADDTDTDDNQTTFPECGGCVRVDSTEREAVIPDAG